MGHRQENDSHQESKTEQISEVLRQRKIDSFKDLETSAKIQPKLIAVLVFDQRPKDKIYRQIQAESFGRYQEDPDAHQSKPEPTGANKDSEV